MYRLLSLIAILAMILFSVPAIAQQPDTAMAGRQGEGLTPPGEQAQPAQPQEPDTGRLTTREGLPGEEPGEAQRAYQEETTEMAEEEGEEMPTTASPLPWIVVAGSLLIGFGLGVRYLRRS